MAEATTDETQVWVVLSYTPYSMDDDDTEPVLVLPSEDEAKRWITAAEKTAGDAKAFYTCSAPMHASAAAALGL